MIEQPRQLMKICAQNAQALINSNARRKLRAYLIIANEEKVQELMNDYICTKRA
jgi:hypothetical protein